MILVINQIIPLVFLGARFGIGTLFLRVLVIQFSSISIRRI